MRIFIAGASGVIGRRVTGLLVQAGHEVIGMTRSEDAAAALEKLGAVPVLCDVYDVEALSGAVIAQRPDLVMNQLTDLPDEPKRIPEFGASNARIRREGVHNLITAMSAAGAKRLVAQSVAWPIPGPGGEAVANLEEQVLAVDGLVVRYGQFYGPDTYFEDGRPDHPRVHIDEAARRTVEVLSRRGIVTIAEE